MQETRLRKKRQKSEDFDGKSHMQSRKRSGRIYRNILTPDNADSLLEIHPEDEQLIKEVEEGDCKFAYSLTDIGETG